MVRIKHFLSGVFKQLSSSVVFRLNLKKFQWNHTLAWEQTNSGTTFQKFPVHGKKSFRNSGTFSIIEMEIISGSFPYVNRNPELQRKPYYLTFGLRVPMHSPPPPSFYWDIMKYICRECLKDQLLIHQNLEFLKINFQEKCIKCVMIHTKKT